MKERLPFWYGFLSSILFIGLLVTIIEIFKNREEETTEDFPPEIDLSELEE